MPVLYVVVGHQNNGGEPMFQKPPHEKKMKKLGVFLLLWFLAASNYRVIMRGNIPQDPCMLY